MIVSLGFESVKVSEGLAKWRGAFEQEVTNAGMNLYERESYGWNRIPNSNV